MIDTQKVRRLLDTPVGVGDGLIRDLCDEIDRLRAPKPQPQGKTVGVKIRVGVDTYGNISVEGISMPSFFANRKFYTLTADLPIPEETTVEAEVENGQSK